MGMKHALSETPSHTGAESHIDSGQESVFCPQLRARSTTQQQHGAHATAKFHPRKTGTASSAPPSPQVTA
eukprot:scaffold116713_cov19-Tisochrysis_lutea.AAC.1